MRVHLVIVAILFTYNSEGVHLLQLLGDEFAISELLR